VEETARILAESFEAGANISEVARRHGVVRGLLSAWRRKFATAAGTQAPGFVPVRIDAGSGPGTAGEADGVAPARTRLPEMASRVARLCGAIEIEMSGARVRVEPGVDATTLSTAASRQGWQARNGRCQPTYVLDCGAVSTMTLAWAFQLYEFFAILAQHIRMYPMATPICAKRRRQHANADLDV